MVRERLLRMHMSAHIIAQERGLWDGLTIFDDACMYCCNSMSITGCQVAIEGNLVIPKCLSHSIPNFSKKFLGTTHLYKSSNKPVMCSDCQPICWISSYTMLQHKREKHNITNENIELNNCIISESEKDEVLKLVKLVKNPTRVHQMPAVVATQQTSPSVMQAVIARVE